MKRKIGLIIIVIFFRLISMAQIKFTNPGFEDTPQVAIPPIGWDACTSTPDCATFYGSGPVYLAAYQGFTYLGLQCDNGVNEVAGQVLNCSLKQKRNHLFTLYAYAVGGYEPVLILGVRLQVWAGLNRCEQDTLLWESSILDTSWHQYTVQFVPNKSYTYISFAIYNSIHNAHSYIGVDGLSEITVDNYNLLSVPFSDTTITKNNCINLNANSDDSMGNLVWSSIPPGFNAPGSLVSACPTQNTKYICTITSECGWQKSDTVNVEVTPNGVENIKGREYLSIYPNPTSNLLQLSNLPAQTSGLQYSIINTLGQLKQSNTLTPGNTSASINVSALPVGVYFIRLTGSKGVVYSGKFVKE